MGPAAGAAAAAFGQPLMPWQQLVADVGLELDDEGLPAYREVIFSTPRQSGKTTLILALEVQRAIGWARMLGAPQHIVYTAQDQTASSKKLVNDQMPLLEAHERRLGIRQFRRGAGDWAVVWRNGSRLDTIASTPQAGHGMVIDLAVKDELFADKDTRRDGAMLPAMLTRPFAQMLTASTMGTPESHAWESKVRLGRAAVEAGKTSGTAYFEWSADPNVDVLNPANWPMWMPALGHTQSVAAIQHTLDTALAEGKLGEWLRTLGNIPTGTAEQTIPAVDWDIVNGPNVVVDDPVAFGVDCNPERTFAGITVAGAHTVEVLDHRAGTGWIVRRCQDLRDSYSLPFVVAKTGPAASFIPALEQAGCEVIELGASEEAKAAGRFYDDIVNHEMAIRRDGDLDRAVSVANRRPAAEAWAWGRKASSDDISLLVAATNAHWHAVAAAAERVSEFILL